MFGLLPVSDPLLHGQFERGGSVDVGQGVCGANLARPLAVLQFSASRRPIRTQLGTANRRASGPRFLQSCTRLSREPPHSLPIVPSIWIEGTMGRLWRSYGGATEMSGR